MCLVCGHAHLRHGSCIASLIHDKIALLRHFKNGDVKQATIQTSSCFTWILSGREQTFYSPFHYKRVTSIIDVTSFIDYVDYNGTTDLKETTFLVLYVDVQTFWDVQRKATLSSEKGSK